MRIARLSAFGAVLLSGCGHGAVSVSDGGPGDSAGGPDLGLFALAAGEAAELPVTGGTTGLTVATPRGDERYLVVLASTRFDLSGDEVDYSIKLDEAPAGAADPARLAGCAIDDAAWKAVMLPEEQPPMGAPPAVGAMKQMEINVGSGAQRFDAQVAAVGQRAVVWVDVTQGHPANLDMTVITDFLQDFDNLILPRERTVFGMESDIDGDGRIDLVFTSLTYKTAVAFFTGCDLLPLAGCTPGNKGEYLYLTPPNAIKPPYNTPAAIKETLAHETSHLVHFGRKVLRNQLKAWDDSSYMIEGVGGFAQDAIGWNAGNLYVTQAGLDGINDFSLGDVLTNGAQYDRTRDGVLRGGGYLFVRWLYDRAGGDLANADGTITSRGGPALLRALLDTKDTMAAALPALVKSRTEDIAMDFYTAVALSNREDIGDAMAANACFRYLPIAVDPKTMKQRGANLFTKFHGMMMNGPAVQLAAAADGMLRAGGVEILEVDATAGAPSIAFTIRVGTGAGDALPRVRIARVR